MTTELLHDINTDILYKELREHKIQQLKRLGLSEDEIELYFEDE